MSTNCRPPPFVSLPTTSVAIGSAQSRTIVTHSRRFPDKGSGQADPSEPRFRRAAPVIYRQRGQNSGEHQSCRSKRSYGESWGHAGG